MWSFQQQKKKKPVRTAREVFSFLSDCGIIRTTNDPEAKEQSSSGKRGSHLCVGDNSQSSRERGSNCEIDSEDEYVPDRTEEIECGSETDNDVEDNNIREIDSEDEYVPDRTEESECGSETDNDVEDTYVRGPKIHQRVASTSTNVISEDCVAESEVESGSDSNIIPLPQFKGQGVDLSRTIDKMTVQKMVPRGSGNRRKWDKRHSCLFCGTLNSKMARHLESKHSDEIEVAKASACKKGTKERKREFLLLLHRGDFKHNKSVIDSKNGSLIPARRQPITDNIESFTTCDECFGLFLKKDLWRHKRKCAALVTKSRGSKKNTNFLLLSIKEDDDSDFQEKILNTMSSDRISFLCRNDNVIIQFGKNMFSKFLDQPHQYQYIKQKMREIGRFLNEMKNESESKIENITQCIDPLLFSTVIKIIKVLAKYDCNTGNYETPSLALKLGHSLKACADILKSKALQIGDNLLEKQAESFIKLYSSDWSHNISSRALNTLHKRKYNKTRRIPLAKDVQLLYRFLQTKLDDAQRSLHENPNPTSWKNLAEIALAQVVLFNRRRGGEMQRMKLENYQNGLTSGKSLQGEIMQSLSSFERNLARQLERVEIRGKRGRRVPVLLTKSHKNSIDLLLDFRQSSGLADNNPYVFGTTGEGENALRTSDILRKFAKGCGANQPNLLTSTALRKHIGTICQLLDLKENELEALATFMGHDKSVHKEYYRLPEDTMQLAKVSKILLQLEKGKIEKCKGKNLDDLEFAEDDAINEEELSADEDDLDFHQDEDCSKIAETPATAIPQIENFQQPNIVEHSSLVSKKSSTRIVKCQSQRKGWSVEEKQAVEMELGNFFFLNRLPGKAHIESAMRKHPILSNRPWKQIKYYIKNIQNKKRKP